MKKLKFLLIPLFSLLFFINVKADTTITSQQFNMVNLYLQHNSDKTIDDFRNLIMSKIEKPDNFDDYAHYIVTINFGSNLIGVQFHMADDFNFGMNNNVPYIMSTVNNEYCTYSEYLYFNSDYTDLNFRTPNQYNCSTGSTTSWMPLYNPLDYMILSSDLLELEYKSPTWTQQAVVFGNTIYQFNSFIPFDKFNLNYNLIVTDYYSSDDNTCLKVAEQIGEASYVSNLIFNIRGNSRLHIKGYIDLKSNQLFQLANNNAGDVTNISYELGQDNTAENVVFSYNVQWVNPSSNQPIYRIYYDLQDTTNAGFDSFMQVVMTVSINGSLSNINYFRDDMYIFVYDGCFSDSISYGYVNYKDNNNVTSDPYLMNYMNNMSLPNMSFLSSLKSIFPQGPVDSILNLPLLMLNSVKSSLESTCQPLVITLPYVNKNITLNCQNNFYSNIGLTNFFNSVGVIASTVMLFQYFIFLYNWIDDVLKLGDTKLKAWGTGEVK